MNKQTIEYEILKNIDKILNHVNLWLVQIDSIMYVNTPLKNISKSLNLFFFFLEHTNENYNYKSVGKYWDILSEFFY